MFVRILTGCLIFTLMAAPLALAQATDDKPTIAMLTFGPDVNEASEIGVLDVLHLYGYLTEAELAAMREDVRDMDGEHLTLIVADAAYDYANIVPLIESALDRGADVLVTETTPVAQAAVNLTMDMEMPVPVIFMSVFNPYAAGIAQAPCIKPDHVAGTERITDYETLLSLLAMQHPQAKAVGTVYASDSASGAFGAQQISAIAESLGLSAHVVAVPTISDIGAAVESLIDKDVDALALTADLLTSEALPTIVGIAEDGGVPVYHPNAVYFALQATVVAGSFATYGPGLNAGHILIGYLDGKIDLATTSVNLVSSMTVAVNLDRSKAMGIDVSDKVLESADFIQQDGGLTITPKGFGNAAMMGEVGMLALLYPEMAADSELITPEMLTMLVQMAFPDPAAAHDDFLASLQCTPEMIAEQQAALDEA